MAADWGILPHLISPLPPTRRFLEVVFGELLEAIPARYVHIGGGPVRVQDVAAFRPVPADWPAATARRLAGTQFQVWTEYIRDGRALDYMTFPRAGAFAEVAWTGGPATWSAGLGVAAEPGSALRDRLAAHARRLDAAGVEYRPLDGPRPWQEGGAGPRRHRAGYRVAEVAAQLHAIAAAPGPSSGSGGDRT